MIENEIKSLVKAIQFDRDLTNTEKDELEMKVLLLAQTIEVYKERHRHV